MTKTTAWKIVACAFAVCLAWTAIALILALRPQCETERLVMLSPDGGVRIELIGEDPWRWLNDPETWNRYRDEQAALGVPEADRVSMSDETHGLLVKEEDEAPASDQPAMLRAGLAYGFNRVCWIEADHGHEVCANADGLFNLETIGPDGTSISLEEGLESGFFTLKRRDEHGLHDDG